MKGTIWCLHGAVGAAADWRGFGWPGWAVQRVDLWRFLACCPMSLPEFGRALNEEAAAAPAGRKVLLGYSMGGRLALHALLANGGGPWDAAVLIGPHPGLESAAERIARRAGDAEWGSQALSGDWKEFLAAWGEQGVLKGTSNIERPTSNVEGGRAERMVLADRAGLIGRRREIARSFIDWSLGAQEPLWERLGEIACPLLWIVGEQDAKFRALAERAVPRIPRAELWIAPAAGHRVPWDTSTAFQERIAAFLASAGKR